MRVLKVFVVSLNSVLLSLFSHRQQVRGLFTSGSGVGGARVNQRKRKNVRIPDSSSAEARLLAGRMLTF